MRPPLPFPFPCETTITPLGTAAPPKKFKMKTKTIAALTACSVGGKVAVETALEFALRPQDQELVKPKRRCNTNSVVFWVSKKPRSSITAVRERVSVIVVVVQELAVGTDPICNMGRRSPEGSIGGAVNEKEEQKLRSSVFADLVHGLDRLHQDSKVVVLGIVLPSGRAKKPVKSDHH